MSKMGMRHRRISAVPALTVQRFDAVEVEDEILSSLAGRAGVSSRDPPWEYRAVSYYKHRSRLVCTQNAFARSEHPRPRKGLRPRLGAGLPPYQRPFSVWCGRRHMKGDRHDRP